MSHPATSHPPGRAGPPDVSVPPRTFQHYEILRREDGTPWELGRGTMGITYKAFDVNLCCEVALKVVNSALLDHPNARERFVREARAAAALPADQYDAEIVEMHHRQKLDAPSGTALAIGEAVATARGVRLSDVRECGRDGVTGARADGAIGFASLRGGQIVGEHTLLFTSADEQVVLSHRAFDRRTFAAGAIRAAHWTAGRAPGLYGMRDVLGLT